MKIEYFEQYMTRRQLEDNLFYLLSKGISDNVLEGNEVPLFFVDGKLVEKIKSDPRKP